MKHSVTVRRELARVVAELDRKDLTSIERAEQYGARQALAWTLGQNAAAPHILTPTPKRAK